MTKAKRDNVFTSFLETLRVKHTSDFSNKYFNKHPHKYNLFGLSKMLSDYGIRNAGTRITDKENDIFDIELPFIAHFGSEFVVVYKIEQNKVHYLWNGKKIVIPVSSFIEAWSGVILLTETTSDSIEPDYKEHRKKELFGFFQKAALFTAVSLILVIAYIFHSLLTNLGLTVLTVLNVLGIYTSYLLVQKQLHIHSQYADKICSLFSKSQTMVSVVPDCAGFAVVQFYFEFFIQLPDFQLVDILVTGCVYAIPVLVFNFLIPQLGKGNQVERLNQEMNSLKANEQVFQILLKAQPYYEVSQSDSLILFGNPEAQLKITVFTNPYCNPCAKMHKRVEELLKTTSNKVCIQYIFSSFEPSLDFANKHLIAVYLEKDTNAMRQIFVDWFEKGKPLKEVFFKDFGLNMANPEIETEFQKHEAWKAKTQLRATPTILINGYQLPENYKIEDLKYFTNMNIEY